MIKALQTKYKGHHFRSRTEARWAVFFDSLKIKYLYEHEDFMLPSGRYLPDFYLPEFEKGTYAEVKGKFTEEDYLKCCEFTEVTGNKILILDGVPDFKCFKYYEIDESKFLKCNKSDCKMWDNEGTCFIDREKNCGAVFGRGVKMYYGIISAQNKYGERMFVYPGFEDKNLYFSEKDWYDNYATAVYESRSARFEFGESGSTYDKW